MKLSILIPARNEMFLKRTVEDILEHIEGDTEILIALDGQWADPALEIHERVKVVYFGESIGQRATTNRLASLATGKYLMKVDAHCAFDQGFDRKMLEAFEKSGDNVVMVPVMRNLHVFNWVCKNGHTRYQGPSGPCKDCGEETIRDIVWIPKTNPQSVSYCFDSEPHFQYFHEWKNTDTYKQQLETGLTETMSLQGSCFMCTKEKYFEYGVGDEKFGSWGSQGIQVACSFWFNGGRVLVNHNTWYAHMFRTQGGDFGFPYPLQDGQVKHAKKTAKQEYFNHNLVKLLNKFWPVKGWTNKDLESLSGQPTRGILYYSDNCIPIKMGVYVKNNLKRFGLPITSVTLKPTNFGNNIHFKGKRGYLTMAKQILTGLKAMKEDIVYFAEHDVLYHTDHFNYMPQDKETWYYNTNYIYLRLHDAKAVRYESRPFSGCIVYRETAIKHFEERIKYIESQGDDLHMLKIGFEPFTHKRIKWDYWCNYVDFVPENPNIDIDHGGNSTKKRYSLDQFKRKPSYFEWVEEIQGWGNAQELVEKINNVKR